MQPIGGWRKCVFGLLAFALGTLSGTAQPAVPKAQQLKAVFLWRLAQFVQWPTNAFEGPESPLVIGVLGPDPFGGALNLAVSGESANNRRIVVRNFQLVEQVSKCHILYIAESETPRLESIIAALRGRSILTVSDAETILRHGGMVRFVAEENKINLRIDLATVKAERLSVDARLLRMAEVTRAR